MSSAISGFTSYIDPYQMGNLDVLPPTAVADAIGMPKHFFVIHTQVVLNGTDAYELVCNADIEDHCDPGLAQVAVDTKVNKGSFGFIYKGSLNTSLSQGSVEVAIKVNQTLTEDRVFSETTLSRLIKEAKLLQRITESDPLDRQHIVRFIAARELSRDKFCLITPLYTSDLLSVVKKKKLNTAQKVHLFCRQLIEGVLFIHKMRIVHCDINPRNILVEKRGGDDALCPRITDFGSAMKNGSVVDSDDYVVTCYYRSMDVSFGLPVTYGIDGWSMGCTLFEICTAKVLFPARNFQGLFHMHYQFLGPAQPDFVSKISQWQEFFDPCHPRTRIHRLAHRYRRTLQAQNRSDFFELALTSRQYWEDGTRKDLCLRQDLLQMVKKLIRWDPELRMNMDKALSDPLFL